MSKDLSLEQGFSSPQEWTAPGGPWTTTTVWKLSLPPPTLCMPLWAPFHLHCTRCCRGPPPPCWTTWVQVSLPLHNPDPAPTRTVWKLPPPLPALCMLLWAPFSIHCIRHSPPPPLPCWTTWVWVSPHLHSPDLAPTRPHGPDSPTDPDTAPPCPASWGSQRGEAQLLHLEWCGGSSGWVRT